MEKRALLPLLIFAACGGQETSRQNVPQSQQGNPVSERSGPVVISVVGTNDLHGHIEALPLLGGYLNLIRQDRAKDGGVVLLDGGDLFQGTLESNSNEGEAVIAAYNALGYTAAAIGNHEFDFGPLGPKAVATEASEDPRGALKARAVQSKFPFLSVNTVDSRSGAPVNWPNVKPSIMTEIAGLKVGIIGGTTESTPQTTISKNVEGLEFPSLVETIKKEAFMLRNRGAEIILVTIHAGGKCRSFDDPKDVSSCEGGEAFPLAEALPKGLVQVIVAGHSHAGISHLVNGVAIIESFSRGAAFGRVDLTVDPNSEQPIQTKIFRPQNLCERGKPPCEAPRYFDSQVVVDEKLAKVIEPYQDQAKSLRDRKTGLSTKTKFRKAYDKESPLGNLVADLMLEARPKGDVAMTNGGGLRADLPMGPITFGDLFEVLPFDNRFATVAMTGKDLKNLIASNLQRRRGIMSFSGIEALAKCKKKKLDVTLFSTKSKRRRIKDGTKLLLVTSDFLAWGGDGAIGRLSLADDAVTIEDGAPIRDVIDKMLAASPRSVSPNQFAPPNKRARLQYPQTRPVNCK